MVRPDTTALSLGHLAAFGCVLTSTGVALIMRQVGREEERIVMVGSVLVGLFLASLSTGVGSWRSVTVIDVLISAASGIAMGVAQFANLEAARRAPASATAPMQYTMLIWGMIYGYLLFADTIALRVLIGAIVVMISCLYILHRERRNGIVPKALEPRGGGSSNSPKGSYGAD